LSNEGDDDHIVTANHENETTPFDDEESIEIQEANEIEVTNKCETMLNENVEINKNTSNGNKIEDKHQSKTANDDSDRNPIPNDKEQSGHSNEISSESNEVTSYPTNERQIIRQHKFYVHSVWLAVQSSYFRSLFYSETKESSTPEVHVQISESEEQVHLMLLEAMYKIDTLDNASVDELLEVLKLAQKYDVKFVFKKCKYCLETMVDSVEIFEKIIRFIKVDNAIADVEDLEKKLQSFLAKEFSPLDKTWQTTRFTELCEYSLKCLLSSDELVAASENTIFHASMYWIEQRGIENVLESQELPSLLSVVRFELIPIDYLYNIVQHNSVAKKLPDFNNHYLRGIYYHALSDTLKRRLPSQPVKRKANTESFIPYTWVIPRDELDKLVLTGNPLKSDKFWYCGYRMVLVISRVIKTRNLRGNKALLNATLSLEVINLAEQSEVIIRWQPASQSFISTPVVETYTFEKKACVSSVDIRYVMEDKQEKVSSNVTGTTTMPGLGSSTSPFKPSGGFSFGPPEPSVTPTTVTPTGSSPSNPSGGLSLSSPKPSVNTTTGTATMSRFGSSTPPSNPSGGLSLSSPKPSVNTTTGTATMSRFGSSTAPSNPSGGLSLSSPKPSVNTTTGTATMSRFGSSTPPSNPSGGLSLSPPESSVNTTTGTATIPGFGSSTSFSNPNGGLSFSSPKPSVNTTNGTPTISRFGSSTAPSIPSGGLGFSSPKPSVNTTTGTPTMPGFGSSTPAPELRGGFSFGTPCTIASEASRLNASTFSFGATPRRNTTKEARPPKQKSPTPLCLSIDVKMNLV
jgi:hypothetical protein